MRTYDAEQALFIAPLQLPTPFPGGGEMGWGVFLSSQQCMFLGYHGANVLNTLLF
jgi:hypothetical protein